MSAVAAAVAVAVAAAVAEEANKPLNWRIRFYDRIRHAFIWSQQTERPAATRQTQAGQLEWKT